MDTGDCSNQAQSQAAAWGCPASFEPVKASSYAAPLGLRNARSVVCYTENNAILVLPERKLDLPASRRVFHCIVEQISDGLKDQIPIALYRGYVCSPEGKIQSSLFGNCAIEIRGVFHQIAEVHRFESSAMRAGLDSRDSQQRGKCVEQLIRIGNSALDLNSMLAVFRKITDQGFESLPEAREWGA